MIEISNMTKRSQIIICILTFLVLINTGCSKRDSKNGKNLLEENKLIVYTSHKPEIYEPIIKEFEERSGIWVQVITGGTNELLEKISEKNGNCNADVMFGGGVDSLVSYEKFFDSYKTAQSEKLDMEYASIDNAYTVFSKLPIVFVYNEKLVITAGKPRSFEEILAPQWFGHIAFANPSSSGSAYTALATMIQALREKYTEGEIISRFAENLNGDICEDSGGVINQVISGKEYIGITLEETALKRIKNGAEIKIVYPKDGTSCVPDGCAILKNAVHKKNAQLFVEFIVCDDVQHFLEDKLSRRSVRKDIQSYEPVAEMKYDIDYAMNEREKILRLWNEATGK